tara:strand:- start:3462 stop:4025 length:564 start_codon:yes stop_codon:yes gene_type:complete
MVGSLKKFVKVHCEQILGIMGLVILLVAFNMYSENKSVYQIGMTAMPDAPNAPNVSNIAKGATNKPNGRIVGASGQSAYATYNGVATAPSTRETNTNKPPANPADLLPTDSNSGWASMNPVGDLQNINLLNPQQVVGINTQGSSLRNANLQVRSEPPNPRTNTNSPWNISTIDGDVFRKPLEIGVNA